MPTTLTERLTQHALHHWLLLAALVAMWGGAFFLIKTSLEALTPAALVFCRLVVGFLVIVPAVVALRPKIPMTWRFFGLVILMSLTGNVVPFYLISWGQEVVPSSTAGIIIAVIPLTIIVLAHLFVVEEPLTARKLLGFGLGFVGVLVLMGPGAFAAMGGDLRTLVRELSILAGALLYSANVIITRRLPAVHPLAVTAAVMAAGVCFSTPLGLPAALRTLPAAQWESILAMALLGVFSTGVATIVYYELIRRAGASFYAVTNYLVPLCATVVGATLGAEPLGPNVLAALALILIGIAVSRTGRQRLLGIARGG